MKKILLLTLACGLLLSGCNLLEPTKTEEVITEDPTGNIETPNDTVPTSKRLDLSNQSLSRIPNYVFNQTGLEELNVSNNQLTGAIQAEIRQLKNLIILDASNNQMTGVPAEIGQLNNLQMLNLSNNELTGLPYELGNLTNLKTLNISGNNYSEADLKTILEKLPNTVNVIK